MITWFLSILFIDYNMGMQYSKNVMISRIYYYDKNKIVIALEVLINQSILIN